MALKASRCPRFGESGFDGFPTALWFGFWRRRGTPSGVIAKLNAAENARLRSADTQAAITKLGMQPRPLSVQEFRAILADEARRWQAVIREAGVRLE